MRLSLTKGAAAGDPNSIAHELEDGTTLVWTLGEDAPEGALLSAGVDLADGPWIMRLDRIDFVPGGIAYRHTHPGPGIRYLLFGALTIESAGETQTYRPGEPWFESGPEPVLATASDSEETAFARVLLLPSEWAGKRTIKYVDPADEDRPKLQKPTVFLEHRLTLT